MNSNAKASADASGADAKIPLLIFGYGNTLRSDDGVGVQIATALAQPLAACGGATLTAHQLLPEHAETLSQAKLVLFVDASCALPTGQIHWRILHPKNIRTNKTTPGHQCDPTALLTLARTLYETKPRAVLISIGINSLDHGENLSPPVLKAQAQLIQQIRTLAKQSPSERTISIKNLCGSAALRLCVSLLVRSQGKRNHQQMRGSNSPCGF